MADFLIAYAAHTPSCTFLLDEDGFCRKIALNGPRRESRNSRRCLNAQYVASLDLRESGGLVEMPTPGAPMLFARVDENGRVALVRTGPVLRFETLREQLRVASSESDVDAPRPDPFVSSASVETSVPAAIIEDLAKREASRRSLALVLDPASSPDSTTTEAAPTTQPDPDYSDESIRTRKMQSITPEEALRLLALHGKDAPVAPPPPPPPSARRPPRSSSRPAPPESHARATEPPPATARSQQPPATLRTPPPADMGIFDDEDDYATVMKRRRGMLPQRAQGAGKRRPG